MYRRPATHAFPYICCMYICAQVPCPPTACICTYLMHAGSLHSRGHRSSHLSPLPYPIPTVHVGVSSVVPRYHRRTLPRWCRGVRAPHNAAGCAEGGTPPASRVGTVRSDAPCRSMRCRGRYDATNVARYRGIWSRWLLRCLSASCNAAHMGIRDDDMSSMSYGTGVVWTHDGGPPPTSCGAAECGNDERGRCVHDARCRRMGGYATREGDACVARWCNMLCRATSVSRLRRAMVWGRWMWTLHAQQCCKMRRKLGIVPSPASHAAVTCADE